jgi:CRP/FNR family transcriptional regulator, cyclic AMP receptor protein
VTSVPRTTKRPDLYGYVYERTPLIGSTTLLDRLPHLEKEKFLHDIVAELDPKHLRRGDSLLSQLPRKQQPIYLIDTGLVKISQLTPSGTAVVGFKTDGELIGEVDALLGRPPAMSAKAVQPTDAWEIPADRFQAHIASHPALATAVIEHLATRVTILEQFRTYKGKVVERLAQCLLDLGLACYPAKTSLSRGFRVPATQAELASSIGVAISAVENELRKIRSAVQSIRGVVHVTQPRYLVECLQKGDIHMPPDYKQRFMPQKPGQPS